MIVIPFNAKIEGKSDIKNYADYLFENAGGAVLTWIIEGAKMVYQNNFQIDPPECVQNTIKVVLCQDLVQVKMRNFSPF